MARITIIGGSGHVGTYLVPRMVEAGHEVINVSRGTARPYRAHKAWEAVQSLALDRADPEFDARVASLASDVVIDMISFELASTQSLVRRLRGRTGFYLFCSTIWVYGGLATVPSTEEEPVSPIDAYGRGKAESEAWLMSEAGLPAAAFRPGHIVGEGWNPITPLGNADPETFSRIARGEVLTLPNLGLEMVHHVHADDVAQWIQCAMATPERAAGQVFNTVSGQAVTMKGFAEAVYRWFGLEPRLAYLPFTEWLQTLPEASRENTAGHVIRSSCHSIAKSRERLGYAPRFSSLAAVRESLADLIARGVVPAPGGLVQG